MVLNARSIALVVIAAVVAPASLGAQEPAVRPPNLVAVTFTPAPALEFPNPTDSNSPAFWDGERFYIFNSWGGQPRRARGRSIDDAVDTNPSGPSSSYTNDGMAGRWLEAVIRDEDAGRLYGWYHQEIETDCPQGRRTWPQIGAAISEDDGESWEDVGVVLTPSEGSVTCDTEHPVTNGGIGDFSVILDSDPDPAPSLPVFHLLELWRRSRGTGDFVRPHAVERARSSVRSVFRAVAGQQVGRHGVGRPGYRRPQRGDLP